MIYKIYGTESTFYNKFKISEKYYISYYLHYIHTEEPYWLDKAYKQSTNIKNTEITNKNIDFGLKTEQHAFPTHKFYEQSYYVTIVVNI